MNSVKLIINSKDFEREFVRCCREYSELELFVAWIGNPANMGWLFENIFRLKSIKANIGVSFYQTSPAGIKLLIKNKVSVRISNDNILFHPKVYIFSKGKQKAILIGSSNLTFCGFYENKEANVLLEGNTHSSVINNFQKELQIWNDKLNSFVPNKEWIKDYETNYKSRINRMRKNRIKDEAVVDREKSFSPSWLGTADWKTYLKYVNEGVKRHDKKYDEGIYKKIATLRRYSEVLKIPWKLSYFEDIENRNMMAGRSGYGWLGHVGASGRINQLLANGTLKERKMIINQINTIAKLKLPIDYGKLKTELKKLTDLKPTMKVWGRFLAMTRPDLYCTISSNRVRDNIAKVLEIKPSSLATIDGYVKLLKYIHESPWYMSIPPKAGRELEIWKRRVAFLDTVFYE